MIVVMLYVFIRKRVIEISTEFFVIKLNSKMCAFSALYEGIGSKQTVQYLHRKKNQDFDQCVRCKYCTVAGGGDMILVLFNDMILYDAVVIIILHEIHHTKIT